MTAPNITIPDESLEAAQKAYSKAAAQGSTVDAWTAACLAMLKAWPGMRRPQVDPRFPSDSQTSPMTTVDLPCIILPLKRQEHE